MEYVISKMNETRDEYNKLVVFIPETQDMMSVTMMTTSHNVIEKQMLDERKHLSECKTFEADKFTKQKSEALKKAALDVIDVYIDGVKNEMTQIENFVSLEKTKDAPEVIDLLDKFDERLRVKYDIFGKIQSELAKEFGITLY